MGEILSKIMGVLQMRGGDFLEFYFEVFLLSVCVIAFGRQLIGLKFAGSIKGPPPARVPHPYVFAYFRGGVREVVTTAVYGLLLRNAVTLDKTTGQISCGMGERARDAVERAVIAAAVFPVELDKLRSGSQFGGMTEYLRSELQRLGWLKSKELWKTERALKWTVMTLFGALGISKLIYALAQGRFNVLYLLGLLTLGLWVLSRAGGSEQTPAGKEAWQHYQQLFCSLLTGVAKRARSNDSQSRENRQLAFAVFGTEPLIRHDPELARLVKTSVERPRFSRGSSVSSSDSSCGSSDIDSSSCGSSSGSSDSSCGSGCGGSCGGGCGGCGGD